MWGAADMGRIPTRDEMRRALEERHGREFQDRLERAAVAVCGLGGLGSNIAIALARAGVGRLILIDFDRVDISNLNRQQYDAEQIGMYKTEALTKNLKRIAPYVELTARCARVDAENCAGLLADADIICEAFDDAEAKAMLVNCVLESMPEKYLVAASGMAGMGPANGIRTRRIAGRFYLCGDGISDVAEENTLIASRAMLCAAHQAHAVMRIIAGKYEV